MASIVGGRLTEARASRGLSQRTLAAAAGTTRQAIGAIEAGRMQPGVAIALRIARALGTTVETLFGEAESAAPPPERVAVGRVGTQTVAHALGGDLLGIEPAVPGVSSVFVAGCDLSTGLLARHAALRSREYRFLWLEMTNREALDALRGGRVHAALVHGEPAVDPAARFASFEVARTEEGWLLARGNPLAFQDASQLSRARARLVNRPRGAAARTLLDRELRRAKLDPAQLPGYARVVAGQRDAGRAVAQGFADAAVGTGSVAQAFGLHFLPLREERCSLVVRRGSERTAEVRAVLETLSSTAYRRDLEALDSYDVTNTGAQIA